MLRIVCMWCPTAPHNSAICVHFSEIRSSQLARVTAPPSSLAAPLLSPSSSLAPRPSCRGEITAAARSWERKRKLCPPLLSLPLSLPPSHSLNRGDYLMIRRAKVTSATVLRSSCGLPPPSPGASWSSPPSSQWTRGRCQSHRRWRRVLR